jgi:hypothetical protein
MRARELREQAPLAVEQPRFHQRGEHGDVLAGLGLAVGERAHAVADFQADIPQEGQEAPHLHVALEPAVVGQQQHQVDVGLRMQLAAPVAADREQIGAAAQRSGEVPPDGEDHLVDDSGALVHQRFDRLIAHKALIEPLPGVGQRLAERGDRVRPVGERLPSSSMSSGCVGGARLARREYRGRLSHRALLRRASGPRGRARSRAPYAPTGRTASDPSSRRSSRRTAAASRGGRR